ncbi:hypothetical protein [Pseudovibrio sp. Tun.PSC04-5.I4]|uniref:hypothetical protein n=1 Tax=Pseudovibrio sp. Tun.PSC04-5.I4 TaxID=1798213 RepID=UPI00117B34DC|nr:hypothetical protein [Pseudovibrio sp. Tun.PSC04-5.I4]
MRFFRRFWLIFSSVKMLFILFKANAAGQHKFTKAKYKVMNWPEYNESLRRRSDVMVWIEKNVARLGLPREQTSWTARQVFGACH